jgi:hypothetical protein
VLRVHASLTMRDLHRSRKALKRGCVSAPAQPRNPIENELRLCADAIACNGFLVSYKWSMSCFECRSPPPCMCPTWQACSNMVGMWLRIHHVRT